MASMPGTTSFINGSMMSGTIAHELGHNFGMNHAKALACTSGTTKVVLSDTCSLSEYGDPFDNMGGGYNSMLSNVRLAEMGWLAALGSSTSPKFLRIARNDGTFLNLELRQPQPPFQPAAPSMISTAPVHRACRSPR